MKNPAGIPLTEMYHDRLPVLLTMQQPMQVEHNPDAIIETILKSRISLEDKLTKFLANRFLSQSQKSQWVGQMIELGADVATRHHVVLRWAAEHNCLKLLHLALQKGSDLHCMKDEPLARAALNGHQEVVDCLLKHGADVHARDEVALRLAASMGYSDVVTTLVGANADVTARNNEVLRKAFDGGHFEVMKICLGQKGRRILDKANQDKDIQIFAIAWHFAIETKDVDLQALLERYEYRPSTKIKLGFTLD